MPLYGFQAAGFVVPGMRVDVLITGLPPGGNALEGAKVRTLLQNIQVLSAGANIEPDKEGKPQQVQVVNLLVTPHQAEILSLTAGKKFGKLPPFPGSFRVEGKDGPAQFDVVFPRSAGVSFATGFCPTRIPLM